MNRKSVCVINHHADSSIYSEHSEHSEGHCPLCRKFKRLMKIFTKANIRKVKLQASRNFPFCFYPAKILKRSNIAAFAWEIKRFVIASSSSFFHYFSGITGNSEQKNILQIVGQLICSLICCYKIIFFWSVLFVNNYPKINLINVATSLFPSH